jgi:hypothetical protein
VLRVAVDDEPSPDGWFKREDAGELLTDLTSRRVTGAFVKSIGCHASRGVRIDESQARAIERAGTGCRNYQQAPAAQVRVSAVSNREPKCWRDRVPEEDPAAPMGESESALPRHSAQHRITRCGVRLSTVDGLPMDLSMNACCRPTLMTAMTARRPSISGSRQPRHVDHPSCNRAVRGSSPRVGSNDSVGGCSTLHDQLVDLCS